MTRLGDCRNYLTSFLYSPCFLEGPACSHGLSCGVTGAFIPSADSALCLPGLTIGALTRDVGSKSAAVLAISVLPSWRCQKSEITVINATYCLTTCTERVAHVGKCPRFVFLLDKHEHLSIPLEAILVSTFEEVLPALSEKLHLVSLVHDLLCATSS